MQSHQQQHGSINNEHQINLNEPQLGTKKKRNLPGMPDPDAEVVALSPNTLMATYRFICEICNKGFQRDQNLQLHRRGHDLPWKLKQRTSSTETRKRVYICPDTSCVHHHPSRALGDLTGIKKHFCRKHGEKKWKCDKCSKKYAVKSDWKSHYKTCGTREYRCDCGIFFSRRDSFITHRAFCDALAEESAKYCASNMPTIEPSATLNLTNSYFRPSEALVFPGETHIFEKNSGKVDTQAFPASWESVIADRYCNAADDQQLPISVGQRDELFQVNGYCNQLSAIAEQHIYPSENARPTTSMTYYGRDQIYKGEAKTLPSHDFQLEKLHDSVTRFAPSINGFQNSDLIAPIAFGSIIQFPETQKMVQFNPNGLSLRPNHNRLDFNASGMQMNPSTLNSEGFPSGFPSDRGLLTLGSGDAYDGRNQSASCLGSIQPSCPHSSATALLMQQEAEIGARISNSDLFKSFDVEGTGTVSVPESAVINLRTPFKDKSGKDHSASTLNSSQILFSTRCTGDIIPFMHKDLQNAWSLPEEWRTSCKLPEIPESGVLNHLNRCTKNANETFGNYLEKDANASETKCSVNGMICGTESQLATFLVDSGHDPFTRDFLGVTRKASNITSMADSEAYHPGLSKIPWQGVTAKSWLQ